MDFNLKDKKSKVDRALVHLENAVAKTSKAYDKQNSIPKTGFASYFNGEERKNAAADLKSAQEDQAYYQNAYNVAFGAYEEAVKLQNVADLAAAEADKAARDEVLEAADLILDTQTVAKVGKSATHGIEVAESAIERQKTKLSAHQRRLNAARVLGFNA